MTITIYTSPDGQEFRNLPRTWNGTTNITERWAVAHGWSIREEEVPDTPEVKTYSKYKLHLVLAEAGIWEPVWNAVAAAGYAQYWNDCNELSGDDEVFQGALQTLLRLMEAGEIALPDGVTVEALLEAARIDA